jgi:hypothetical protein
MKYLAISLMSVLSIGFLAGCEQEKVKLTSVEIMSRDDGNPDFRRLIQYCFDHPIKGGYYHEVAIESKDGFILEGYGVLRPASSDPDNKCIVRNMNQYVSKKSPPRARDLIETYLTKGNVASVRVTVWQGDSPERSEKMEQKTFNNL